MRSGQSTKPTRKTIIASILVFGGAYEIQDETRRFQVRESEYFDIERSDAEDSHQSFGLSQNRFTLLRRLRRRLNETTKQICSFLNRSNKCFKWSAAKLWWQIPFSSLCLSLFPPFSISSFLCLSHSGSGDKVIEGTTVTIHKGNSNVGRLHFGGKNLSKFKDEMKKCDEILCCHIQTGWHRHRFFSVRSAQSSSVGSLFSLHGFPFKICNIVALFFSRYFFLLPPADWLAHKNRVWGRLSCRNNNFD